MEKAAQRDSRGDKCTAAGVGPAAVATKQCHHRRQAPTCCTPCTATVEMPLVVTSTVPKVPVSSTSPELHAEPMAEEA